MSPLLLFFFRSFLTHFTDLYFHMHFIMSLGMLDYDVSWKQPGEV